MNEDDLMAEIDIKYGEIIEGLSKREVIPFFIKILLGMLLETRLDNKYLKERLDKCQH